MPFITLTQIKPFISANRYSAISTSGNFATYESSAAKKIRDVTGYAIPEDEANRPDWVDPIAAWIIDYLALPIIPGDSEEEVNRIKSNYKLAFSEMQNYRKAVADGSETNESVNCGSFEEEDAW